jgi:predicted transcriptional regulator
MSPADLAEDLGKTETHIRKELSEGVRNYKMFVRLENGNYANVKKGDDDIQWELN